MTNKHHAKIGKFQVNCKIVGYTELFNYGMANNQGEGKLWI